MVGSNQAIGIFDSGLGGLTVLSKAQQLLPNENFIYFGDTLRVPYGSRSKDELLCFARQIFNFLISKNVKAIVIACNTISATCLPEIKKEFDLPIVEVLSHGVFEALESGTNNLVVIATETTIKNGTHERMIREHHADLKLFTKACPKLVPLVEEGLWNTEAAYDAVDEYLHEFKSQNIDALLLGCTHYPLLADAIVKTLGQIKIIDPSVSTINKLKVILQENHLMNIEHSNPCHQFFISGATEKFDDKLNIILIGNYKSTCIEINKF